MAMALEGLKVLDLATVWAAPGCAMYLADQGADVIKVESPAGDDSRRLLTHRALGNESPSFLVINRNKRGIVVDIRKPAWPRDHSETGPPVERAHPQLSASGRETSRAEL